ncbi:dipeptidyl aminopeptidase/acylaminoacyl peptidase [Spinactinospora alkalitolerans]|uniref:Dipeptidyl aminopeptidase/acylaminoacyl peptidase n=1 Tax=Spinactinospora alkalitolerans TaxID=687207 RepID=A0A852TQQ9_9ACTN|nr:S9 family peptidase [Spinactinospora alkalitolerans]NYE46736.1 dipeptidyl aminopeptidase/acylaminoacyl peptidase [Spinactinospora alkalitolerans]
MVRPWHELTGYIALRRVNGLRLSPDGTRLVAPVSEPEPDGKAFGSALWEIDPAGEAEPRRLTRSAAGESAPRFLPDGSVLFTSKRPDPEAEPGEEARPSLWLLPADGGEARRVASHPGGIGAVEVAREAGTVVYSAEVHPGAADAEADEQARKARKDAGVSAILHEEHPVRYWDHDLGPARTRLFAAAPPAGAGARLGEARDLTPEPGMALHVQSQALTPDGGTVVTGWAVPHGRADRRGELAAIDTATGERRVLASHPDFDFAAPAVSPDGRGVAAVRSSQGEYDGEPRDETLWLVDLATGEGRDLLAGHELWPREHAWAPDSRAVYVVADLDGRRPVFRVDLETGELVRLTGEGAYSQLNPAPDGRTLYALRDSWDEPPTPVRIDTGATGQDPVRLKSPCPPLEVPGRLTEVETAADDGTRVRAWLVLPAEASADSPAPLLLWVHGGPYMSFNGWSWRWNPWLMAARGYAVLLPDPALSTGYGQGMLRRAWGAWGPRTFADLMAVTDAAVARGDIDAERTAVMGGSFGGYMANWIAGHTDRFKAVVTHASLWALDGFHATTDYPPVWMREFGDPHTRPERYELNSPHRHVAAIRTPVLVIHGDRDYRVPIGEGLRLWWDLLDHGVEAKFLYFPDENHWILKPGNIEVWYETVFAFLDHHVHGKEWRRPRLL